MAKKEYKHAIIQLDPNPNMVYNEGEEENNIEDFYHDGLLTRIVIGKPVVVSIEQAQRLVDMGRIKNYTLVE